MRDTQVLLYGPVDGPTGYDVLTRMVAFQLWVRSIRTRVFKFQGWSGDRVRYNTEPLIEELTKLGPDQIVLSKGASDAIGLDGHGTAKTAFPKWLLDLNLSERRILLYLSKGLRNEEIAGKVCLGKQTVRNYLTTIYRKMNAETRYEAILLALDAHIKDLVEE